MLFPATMLLVTALFAHVLESGFEPDMALGLFVTLLVTNLVTLMTFARHVSLLWGLPMNETHATFPYRRLSRCSPIGSIQHDYFYRVKK
jgi:hypothetical protein